MGYCERCGGRFDYEGICKTCRDDEEWSWNTPHNQNKVKCEHCGCEIYEVRRYCFLCGAKNETAFKKGENYCPHCGNAFENGICPDCGKSLLHFQQRDLEAEEKRYCPVCEGEVSKKDYFCIHCGNENYINHPLTVSPSAAAKEEKEFLERMKVRNEIRRKQLHDYNERNERRRELMRRRREEAERSKKSEGHEDAKIHEENLDRREKYSQNNREAVKYYDNHKTAYDINSTLWLVLGIVSLVLCCMPTGIGTIIYAIQASNCAREGMMNLAERKIRNAKIYFFIGIGIIALLMISSVIIQVLSMS